MTKNESKLLSLQGIAKASAFCLLLSAFSVNAAMAVPASVGTVDEVMGVQQDKKVTGTVVDEAGIPVIGANVIQKGTTNGVITDLDGNFSLEIPNGAVIEISYIGYMTQSIPINGKTTFNIILEEDTQKLDEVVVLGYGAGQRKQDLSASVGVLNNTEDLVARPVTSTESMLQGQLAGVTVQANGGDPTATPSIVIRGQGSQNGDNVLWVVDGVPGAPIASMNDIETIVVLKDAASAAIYGAQSGAGGVILVTTKKAKEGQTRVNINGSFGFKSITDKIALTDAEGFKLLYNEQLRNEGNPEYNFSDWTGNTNWQDEIFQTGFITNNNISITGASDKNSFYLGAGYAYEQGNIKHEKYSKITLNISNDYKVTDNLKVGFQFNGARMLPADTKSVATALRAAPVAHVFNSEYGLYTSLPGFQKAQMNNPMVDVDLKANTTKAENYRGSGQRVRAMGFPETLPVQGHVLPGLCLEQHTDIHPGYPGI